MRQRLHCGTRMPAGCSPLCPTAAACCRWRSHGTAPPSRPAATSGRGALGDTATGQPLVTNLPHKTAKFDPTLENRPAPVFTPDGRRLLTAAGANVYIWDGSSGKALGAIDLRGGSIKHLAVSPDGV